MVNDILRDMDIDDATRDAHTTCVECQAEGCSGCGSAVCELPRLVEHAKELMHEGCIAAFDRHIENRCTGDVCNCCVPELVDDVDETTPAPHMSDAEMLAEHRALRAVGGAL